MDRYKVWTKLNYWRTMGGYLLILLSGKHYSKKIFSEIDYWFSCNGLTLEGSSFYRFSYLLCNYKEYRNLIRLRFSQRKNVGLKILSEIALATFPKLSTLFLSTSEVGWNLFIQHGFSTVTSAKQIGEYCWINQQVTIGYSYDSEAPIIGNGVTVCAGAKVIGSVKIGDNAIIGANAVVVKDVGENEIVGGVPAKVIGINDRYKRYTKG